MLGYAAAEVAAEDFALGSVGAGLGATTVDLKAGVGSASAQTREGITIGALAVVNAAGSTVIVDASALPGAVGTRRRTRRLMQAGGWIT